MAGLSYDAASLLLHVLKQAGDLPPHQAFPLGSSFPGATGILTFDSEGNRKVRLQLLEARHGRFVALKNE
jgi:ABC-type branched-subunit amino acid transport system substrate-binding protein